MKPPKALPITAADKEESARKERLRLALPAAVELLRTRQAGLIAAAEIEEFVALNWLEWHGGSLKLTVFSRSNVIVYCWMLKSKFLGPGAMAASKLVRTQTTSSCANPSWSATA